MTNLRKQKIRKKLSDVYRKSDIGYYLLRPFFKIYVQVLKLIPDEIIVKKSFKQHMGYSLNLNNPETLNEKINWLKLYNRKELHTIVADKYKVRAYIEKKIGNQYLIPLLYHTKNYRDIKPENLPDTKFIIKTNHDSSGGLIVRDKSQINWGKARNRFKRLLKENHYYSTREWQYKNISPMLIVEKLLLHENGSIPEDYKFHCFNGKFGFVGVDLDRESNNRTRNLYDSQWNLLPCNWGRPNGRKLEKPTNYEEMIRLAETIAQDFIYVRVDFYSIRGCTFFGEITLHHSSGLKEFLQKECDYKLGKLLKLDINNEK
ncbi:ATP-grasp fold amidoligase family protein [Winogradskyella sp. UBA3174]|uniref:ATP-grasp fold amidoligase family protein n=1 Tax=Winogradskyella sp. UBA3174 TaxID=1947785 RepID=UPI0025F8CBEE|nr:ATP-grasp fold amidoligase family protein [Winogradskyella sp. UBA3174]|tara:strand:- start:49703 stop:50653 length:951 start_codon:yes stop_codon:yes gene_type:complete